MRSRGEGKGEGTGKEDLVFLGIRRGGELRGLPGDDNFLGVSVGVPGAVVKSSRVDYADCRSRRLRLRGCSRSCR